MHLNDFLLPLEGFQVVRHGHQVRLRGQLKGGMSPITISENPQLAAFDKFCQSFLDIRKISRRTFCPFGNALSQGRGGHWIGLERAHHIDPIQGVQMIKMHHVIMNVLSAEHDITD